MLRSPEKSNDGNDVHKSSLDVKMAPVCTCGIFRLRSLLTCLPVWPVLDFPTPQPEPDFREFREFRKRPPQKQNKTSKHLSGYIWDTVLSVSVHWIVTQNCRSVDVRDGTLKSGQVWDRSHDGWEIWDSLLKRWKLRDNSRDIFPKIYAKLMAIKPWKFFGYPL